VIGAFRTEVVGILVIAQVTPCHDAPRASECNPPTSLAAVKYAVMTLKVVFASDLCWLPCAQKRTRNGASTQNQPRN